MRHYITNYTVNGAILALLSVALSAGPASSVEVGVTAATNPTATGQPPGQTVRELKIGLNIVRNERIRTTEEGATQVIFTDRMALTIGPNSDITIDEFVFNPDTNSGNLAIRMGNGLLRYIGGQISHTDQVRITTPTATMGIRGGMALINSANGKTTVVHLYGTTTVTTPSNSVTIARPGYYAETNGTQISAPSPAPAVLLTSLNAELASKPGQTGGAAPGLVTSATVNAAGNSGQTNFTGQSSSSNAPSVSPGPMVTGSVGGGGGGGVGGGVGGGGVGGGGVGGVGSVSGVGAGSIEHGKALGRTEQFGLGNNLGGPPKKSH
jgi:hypothetical protein